MIDLAEITDLNGIDGILTVLIGALTYFLKGKMATFEKMHGEHYKHAAEQKIHQESMSKELIEAKFEGVIERIGHLKDVVATQNDKIDGLSEHIANLITAIKRQA